MKCHGLVRCDSDKKCLWNRDLNAALNILLIATETIQGNGRPEYLQRKKLPNTVPEDSSDSEN